jgi:molybdopterin synthase sulfur carrier subunit
MEGSPVNVHFYATLRAIVGRKTVEIAVPDGADVQELVEAVVGQFPDLGEFLLDADGLVPRGVHVFVNGRGAGYLADGYATRLTADDRLDLFPAVAGG